MPLQLDTKTSLDIVMVPETVANDQLQLDTKTSLDIVRPLGW